MTGSCCGPSCWVGCLAVALCSTPRPAQAELDAQTQLSCLLDSGDLSSSTADDVAATGEELDLEHSASRRSGRENRLRLTSSLEQAGYLPGVSTAARLSLELDLDALASDSVVLRDASSFLGVAWQTGSLRLALRAYPLDTDEWRLGYLHALDWGGSDRRRGESIFIDQHGGVPGARLELGWPRARLFSGVKWARSSHSPLRDAERSWGLLSGGSFELSSRLRAELGFGYFEREASFVEGVSARLSWHHGVHEPELATEPFRPLILRDEARRFDTEAAPGAALALEGVALAQRARGGAASLEAPLAPAPGAAIYGSWRGQALAAHGALTWRSLELVLRNTRGGLRGQGVAASAALLPELAAWFGASLTLLPAHLVPSLELGCLLPAALQSPSSLPGSTQTFVVRDAGTLTPLPLGAGRLPIFAGRLGLRFQASSALSLGTFATYERDANRSVIHTRAVRVFAKPDRLHVTGAAWARF